MKKPFKIVKIRRISFYHAIFQDMRIKVRKFFQKKLSKCSLIEGKNPCICSFSLEICLTLIRTRPCTIAEHVVTLITSGHKYHTGIQRPQGPLDPSHFGVVAPRSKPEGWFKTESRVWLQTMPLFTNSRPAVLWGDDYIRNHPKGSNHGYNHPPLVVLLIILK